MEDSFYNAGNGELYLRIDGQYYRRRKGRGWERITEQQVPENAYFAKLHEKQREAYVPVLPKE